MKDEADKVTIDAFDADHNPALHAEAAAKGLTRGNCSVTAYGRRRGW